MHDEVEEIALQAEEWLKAVQGWPIAKFGAVLSTLIAVYLRDNVCPDGWEKFFDSLHKIGLRRTKAGFGGAESELRGPLH